MRTTCTPPKLLVSVRSVREAASALRGGADLIDIKEPRAGPLGMASPTTIDAIVRHVNAARPVTAALGELHERDGAEVPDAPAHDGALRYVKLGLARAPGDWRVQLNNHLEAIGCERFIAVAYADHARAAAPPIERVLDWAVTRRVAGLLIDTAGKDGRGLLHWCALDTLDRLIRTAHAHDLLIALAGSLDACTIEALIPLAPDVIAVRGAACDGSDRRATVCARRVADLKALSAARSAASIASAPPCCAD